jgi:beta-glucanase (GH16 family)
VIGEFAPESSGGWTIYTEQQTAVTNISGIHDLYLVGVGGSGVCNLDWLQFSTNTIYVPDYVLTWSDEFSGTTLNTNKWFPVQHGDVDNGELQFYTDREDNIIVSNDCLWLIARQETYAGTGPWMSGIVTSEYTSGKVQGLGKYSVQYGKIEARMKLPRGAGTWPAFWLLGDNIFDDGIGWPRCGEIDIIEHANILDTIGAAVHTEAYNHYDGTQKAMGYAISDYDTAFHVYGVEWTPEKLAFYVDDDVFFILTKAEMGSTEAEWSFDQPFWMNLNLAVGGAWGGDPTDGTYPYALLIDWVRVYQDQAL